MLGLLAVLSAPAQADVELTIRDGNPFDRIWIKNAADCGALTAILHIDLGPSAGRLLLDTVRGGPGTKDPMPVEVERGPLRIDPVQDGATDLTVQIGALRAGDTASLTMDFDDQAGWWPGPRVEVFGDEIAGTVATLRVKGDSARAVFDTQGTAVLQDPSAPDCNAPPQPDAPFDTVPTS